MKPHGRTYTAKTPAGTARLTLTVTGAGAGLPASGKPLDRETVIRSFIAAQDVRPSSKKTYRESIVHYFDWLERTGRPLQGISETDIVAYKTDLLAGGLSPLTIRSYLVAVRRFYDWAEHNRLYANVAAGVKSPRLNQGGGAAHFMKMHLTDGEASALLEHFRGHPRNYAMVNLMLRTGLRSVEVSRARIQDVTRRSGRRILQVWGKGMDATDPNVFVILTDAAWDPIADYLALRPGARPGDFLFVTEGTGYNESLTPDGRPYTREHNGGQMSTRLIQLTVKKGMRAIGLDDHAYSTHSLRHTTGVQMIKAGATILDVKRTLRHASVNTSMIYIASVEEEEHLRNAPEGLLDGAFGKTGTEHATDNQ